MKTVHPSLRSIGAALRAAREHHGLTLEQLELNTAMSPQSLSAIELGKRNVSLLTLQIVAGAIGYDVVVSFKKQNAKASPR